MAEQQSRTTSESSDPHEMDLVRVDDESGAEHWTCPTCGRQMLLWWPPDYRRTVLIPGDESVGHTASKGEVEFRLTDLWLRPGATERLN